LIRGSRLGTNSLDNLLNIAGVYVLVLVLVVVGLATSPSFLVPIEVVGTIQNVALLGIVAVGVSFVTYSGHYADLSVPSIMALSGIISVSTLKWGFAPSLACGVAAGLAIGAINGWVVGYLRANPIIWTLVTAAAGDGFIRWAFSNKQAYPDVSGPAGSLFVGLYEAKIFGVVPLTILILAALLVAGQLLLSFTKFGAQIKLVGSSYDVAKMTGIDTRRVTCTAFLISALTASIAGILLTSLNKTGASTIGKGYDFLAVTAVVIGGVTLAGGRGNVVGVLGGVLAIGLMNKVMSVGGIGTFQQQVVQGCVFILVVGLGAIAARRAGRDDA
jgi:ribose/xylose/arabinose/galactoside ABC-type transport system permease subunit